MKKIFIVLLMICLVACEANVEPASTENVVEEIESEIEITFESENIEEFYDELFVGILNRNPQYIDDLGDLTSYGVEFQKDKLTPSDENYHKEMVQFYEKALSQLNSYGVDDINYRNVKWYLEIELGELQYRRQEFFLSSIIGEHRSLHTLLLETHIIETKEDAEDWIMRVENSQLVINDWINRYNKVTEAGYLMDPYAIDNTIRQISSYSKSKIIFMDLYKRFKKDVENLELDSIEEEKLIADAEEKLEKYYNPSMNALKNALYDSKDVSKESNGVWALPDGEAYYEFALKRHTTTDMTPEEIHQLGLNEVDRIQKEMMSAFEELGYNGSLGENLDVLSRAAKGYSGQEAMDEYVKVASLIHDNLSDFFYKEDLPASRPDIRTSPGGNFYVTPSIDGKRSGVYYLDLGGVHLDYGINTLAFHETVPGHHLEREHELLLENIPMVRKIAFNTAYIEGWALYAEMLADESGFNPTPEHRIGYLKSELHRAARLVVDTGIHYKKWSRTQAIDYLVMEGMLHPGYAQVEVTRYTTWPGQACAYKIGQLKIKELRDYTKEQMGSEYDIRAFHHLILGNGSMPLELLEEYVKSSL